MIYSPRNPRRVARYAGPAAGRKSIHFSQMRAGTGAPDYILKIGEIS